jgi:hypothetical protein
VLICVSFLLAAEALALENAGETPTVHN